MVEINSAKQESSANSSIARIEIPHMGALNCPYCGGARKDCLSEFGGSWEWNCSVCGRHFVLKPRIILTYELPGETPRRCQTCGSSDIITKDVEASMAGSKSDKREEEWHCKQCKEKCRAVRKMFVEYIEEGEYQTYKTENEEYSKVAHSTIARKELTMMVDSKCPYCNSEKIVFIPDWSFPGLETWSCHDCGKYFTTKRKWIITCEAIDGSEGGVFCPYCFLNGNGSIDDITTVNGNPTADSSEEDWACYACYSCGGIFKATHKVFVEFKREDK